MESRTKEVVNKIRINYFDIAKGIGIIMVVWAHAGGPFSKYMYQMHMPFFFIISGLLYSSNKPLRQYLVGKVKSLYIPFAFWNILFYSVKTIRHGGEWFSILKTDILIALTLEKDGQYFGATWFLGALFMVSVVYKIADTLIKDSKYKPFLMLSFFTCFGIIGFQITFRFMLSRTIICGMFFAIGVFVNKNVEHLKDLSCFGSALICALTFVVIGHYGSANMGTNEYRYPVLFVIGAVMASYALIYLCKVFDETYIRAFKPMKKTLILLGKNSMDIVIWQFNAFRLVTILQMKLYGDQITWENVLQHYPCYVTENGWWIVYTVVGLVVPILFCGVLRSKPWGKVFMNMHIV